MSNLLEEADTVGQLFSRPSHILLSTQSVRLQAASCPNLTALPLLGADARTGPSTIHKIEETSSWHLKVKKLLHNPLSLLGRVPALIERDFMSVHCTRLKSCNCMACLGSCALPVHLHSHDFTIAGENLREQLNILNAKTFVIVGTSSWHMLAYVGTFRTSSSVS
jgi:hypothetical protein